MENDTEEGYPLSADGWISCAWSTIRSRGADVYRGVAVLLCYQLILYLMDIIPGSVVATVLIQLSAGLVLSVGWLGYCLRIVRGKKVSIKNIFDGFAIFADVWIVSIGLSLLVFLGLLFFVVPGIYILVRYGLCLFAILDRKEGPKGAFLFGSRISEGHRPQIAIIYLIALGLYMLAAFPVITGYQNLGTAALLIYNFAVTPMISLILASAYDSLVFAVSQRE